MERFFPGDGKKLTIVSIGRRARSARPTFFAEEYVVLSALAHDLLIRGVVKTERKRCHEKQENKENRTGWGTPGIERGEGD